MGGSWLPGEIEIILLENGHVVVSEHQGSDSHCTSNKKENGAETNISPSPTSSAWLICDGATEISSDVPASEKPDFLSNLPSPVAHTYRMGLFAIISSIFTEKEEGISGDKHKGHPIIHMKLPQDPCQPSTSDHKWHCFNDFQVTYESFEEVTTFLGGHLESYRHPSIIFFTLKDCEPESIISTSRSSTNVVNMPASVFNIRSLSTVPSIKPSLSILPKRGDLIAFDGEFVSIEAAKSTVDNSGNDLVCIVN